MTKIDKIIIFTISNMLLMGCGGDTGWFRDRSKDYVKAERCPTLKIPADTHSETFSEEYQIPET